MILFDYGLEELVEVYCEGGFEELWCELDWVSDYREQRLKKVTISAA